MPVMEKTTPSLISSRPDWQDNVRPTRITVPARANPLAKLVFAEMARQGVTYAELEHRSNVLTSTFKAWRTDNSPGLASIEAALGALGWALVPVPNPKLLSPELREAVNTLARSFTSDAECMANAVRAAALLPDVAASKMRQFAQLRKAA